MVSESAVAGLGVSLMILFLSALVFLRFSVARDLAPLLVKVSKADLWRGLDWFLFSVKLRKDGYILFNSNLVQVGSLLDNSSWCVAPNLHLLAALLLFWNQICFS